MVGNYILPEDQARVLDAIASAIRNKEVFELEHRVRQEDDGDVGWTHSRAIPVLNDAGDIEEWFGMATDITAQKRAVEQLIQSEKLAAMGRLAASIAHEVNNPLESVTNLIFLARTSDNLADARDYLQQAETELARAVAITNQTLRFHKQSTNPIAVNPHALLGHVLLVHRGRIANARVTVEERNRTEVEIRCFEGEIKQVLSNLVGNATDAMQKNGGGRLLVRSRAGRHWKTGQAGVILTVADNGPGMSVMTQEKAFQAFYTTKGMEGTGLGLWVSKEIVSRHKGDLRFKSSQRPQMHGTVFALFLPSDAETR